MAREQVPDADAHEIKLLAQARRHLPSEVFDAARWRKIVGEKNWPKVVFVLNLGGRFEDANNAFKGELRAQRVGHIPGMTRPSMARGLFFAIWEREKIGLLQTAPELPKIGQGLMVLLISP